MSKAANVLLGIAGFIIVILILDRLFLKEENETLKRQVNTNEDLDAKIKAMLRELIDRTKSSDPNVAKELAGIVALINIKQESGALMKLAKVIENLLAEHYADEPRAAEIAKSNGRKKPAFADLLELAKEKKLITQEDFHLISVLKGIRNEEAHELNVKKEASRVLAAMIAGIMFIMTLCKLLKRTTIDPIPA